MVGVGHVEIIQSPANPQDGEKIFAVESVSLEVARERFEATGRLDLAERALEVRWNREVAAGGHHTLCRWMGSPDPCPRRVHTGRDSPGELSPNEG